MRFAIEFTAAVRTVALWYQARVPSWLRVVIVIAWAGLIWWLSSRPPAPPQPHFALYSHVWNSGHVVIFGVLGGLVMLSSQKCTGGWAAVAILLSAAFGVTDELHQWTVVGRDADIWDACSDALGASLAVSGLYWVIRRHRRAGAVFLVCLPLAVASVHMASR